MRRMTVLLMILGMLVLPVAAQDVTDGPPTADAETLCFEKSGIFDAETGQCERHMNIDMAMDVPLELADTPFIMDAVDAYYAETRLQFMNNATESGFAPGPVYNWILDVSYTVAAQTESLVSVIFYAYEYTGGAHGITLMHTMTFDLATETQLALEDLFADGVVPYETISAYAATVLEERLGVDATFSEGYTPDPANYLNWTLAADGLTIHFAQYQVASYAAGIQTVTIPFAELGIALPEYFG